ncbi:MAG TPA: hypothetical protein VFT45_20830 [Longimicrobium sp.]|nr:hypothetical protein [Longimicrobium sp.]
MKKIRLDVDRLDVESFPTASGTIDVRGTVHANSDRSMYCMETDWAVYTCGVSCAVMCYHTLEFPGCSD